MEFYYKIKILENITCTIYQQTDQPTIQRYLVEKKFARIISCCNCVLIEIVEANLRRSDKETIFVGSKCDPRQCMTSLTVTMRGGSVGSDGWISKNSKPATRACNRPAFTRLASAWWRQADLSVSTNTQLAFAHRLALLDWLLARRKVQQTCSRNHVFLYMYIVYRPFSRVRASNDSSTMRRVIVPTSLYRQLLFLHLHKVHQLPPVCSPVSFIRELFFRQLLSPTRGILFYGFSFPSFLTIDVNIRGERRQPRYITIAR